MSRFPVILLLWVTAVWGRQFSFPLAFEPNSGQAPDKVRYLTHSGECLVRLLDAGSTEAVCKKGRFAMIFQGARAAAPAAEDLLPGTTGYLVGNAPSRWNTGIPTYRRVRYRSIYRGIDLVDYGTDRGMEYDLELSPGADPQQIQIRFPGARSLRVNRAGELLIETETGIVRQPPPRIYQDQKAIAGRYRVEGRNVRFHLGPYDHQRPLIIDPTLTWASYFGTANEEAWATTVDASGNIYIAGSRLSSSGAGDLNIFVAKLNKDGTAALLTREIGGSGNDLANAIAVDVTGNIYLAGYTASNDFPVKGTSQNLRGQNTDAFFMKLPPSGQDFVYSNYLGGSASDSANALALDGSGNLWICGQTASADFFTTANAPQRTFGGAIDAFLARIDTNGQAVYSTYFGGSGNDAAYAAAVGPDGSVYLAGATTSSNFPTAGSAYQSQLAGDTDGFVARFSSAGAPIWSTYFGGRMRQSCVNCVADDFLQGIAVDAAGAAYVTGYTTSLDFPTLNAYQSVFGGGVQTGDAVALKLNADGGLVFSTYLGGSSEDAGVGAAIDAAGNLYIAGNTSSTNFPVLNAFQSSYHGGVDGFVAALTPAGNALVFSSFLGGSGADTIHAVAVQCTVGTVIAGKTASNDFPITAGVVQPTLQGSSSGFVARVAAGFASPVVSSGSVVNAATLRPGPVAPGSLITIFGTNLAAATASASSTTLPTALAGASITSAEAGITASAPISYASPAQLNVQLPYEIPPGMASLTVTSCAGTSPQATFPVAQAAPYIFPYGNGAAIVNQNGTINSVSNTAPRGGYVIVYLTGIGPVTNAPATGAPALSSPLSMATLNANATIGGAPATIQFLGLAPGYVGLAQANIFVPSSIGSGAQPLVINVNNAASNIVQLYVQ